MCYIYEPKKLKNREYYVGNKFFRVKKGVYIKIDQSFLINGIKGIEIKQYLHQRLLNNYTVVLYLNSRNIIIYDIKKEDAFYLENKFNGNVDNEI